MNYTPPNQRFEIRLLGTKVKMGNIYHTLADMAPFSIFEEYICRECNKEWMSNEALIGICPVCNRDKDIYYQSLITCPKCKKQDFLKKRVGKREQDYCYYCRVCEDQIAKEAIFKI